MSATEEMVADQNKQNSLAIEIREEVRRRLIGLELIELPLCPTAFGAVEEAEKLINDFLLRHEGGK